MAVTESKITGWLLEYVYQTAWDTFKKKRSIDEDCCRDIIQWLVSQQSVVQTSNPQHMMQLQILLQMSRLTDGENYETRYSDDNDWTVLEDMLISFNGLANSLPESFKPMMEKNRDLIIKQAVLVACREDDFIAAQEIFQRISNQITDKGITDKLKAVLVAESKDHKYVTNKMNSYTSFVSNCIIMISDINKEFDVPFLTKVADVQRRQEKKHKDTNLSDNNRKRLALLKAVSKKMLAGKESLALNQGDEREMREALRTTRDRVVDSLLDDVAPPPKKIRKDFKSPEKVPHQHMKTLSPVSDDEENDKRTDLDFNPLRSPKGIRQHSYRKNISRPDRHTTDRSDGANSDDQEDGSEKEQPLRKRVENKQNYISSPFQSQRSILRPSSPTESTFSSRKTMWGYKETEEFYQAVQEFGVGRWGEIRKALGTFRTNVNLKDKWRTILKTKEILSLEKKFGPV